MTAQMSVRIPLALKFSLAHSIFRGGGFRSFLLLLIIITLKNTTLAYEEELLHLTLTR